eukprot:snap_masked-scaffold_68-processed-gene-0.45-mRNA-1 protein AED:1.00 eAED:1.00 QI:0/-1/0/0/-1/1/1/0/359
MANEKLGIGQKQFFPKALGVFSLLILFFIYLSDETLMECLNISLNQFTEQYQQRVQKRIALFYVYTGKPAPLKLPYLQTYSHNSNLLDLFIILDNQNLTKSIQTILELPEVNNLFLLEYENLSSFIKEKLEGRIQGLKFPISTENFGWNLCDVRPFYYTVFADEVSRVSNRKYTHWGWTDTHTYLGNLSHFLSNELLNSDVISFLETSANGIFTSGTLSLFTTKKEIWSNMEEEVVLRTLLDPKNNQNDEYRFSNSVLRWDQISFSAIVSNVRNYKDIIYSNGSLWSKEPTLEKRIDLPKQVQVSGRWIKGEKIEMEKPFTVNTVYRRSSLSQLWMLESLSVDSKEIAVCHCRKLCSGC